MHELVCVQKRNVFMVKVVVLRGEDQPAESDEAKNRMLKLNVALCLGHDFLVTAGTSLIIKTGARSNEMVSILRAAFQNKSHHGAGNETHGPYSHNTTNLCRN